MPSLQLLRTADAEIFKETLVRKEADGRVARRPLTAQYGTGLGSLTLEDDKCASFSSPASGPARPPVAPGCTGPADAAEDAGSRSLEERVRLALEQARLVSPASTRPPRPSRAAKTAREGRAPRPGPAAAGGGRPLSGGAGGRDFS